jgi:hypothetical protein
MATLRIFDVNSEKFDVWTVCRFSLVIRCAQDAKCRTPWRSTQTSPRRSYFPNVIRYRCASECNCIHARKESTAVPAQLFVTLTETEQLFVTLRHWAAFRDTHRDWAAFRDTQRHWSAFRDTHRDREAFRDTQRRWEASWTEVNANRTIDVESKSRNSFTSPNKAWLSLHWF